MLRNAMQQLAKAQSKNVAEAVGQQSEQLATKVKVSVGYFLLGTGYAAAAIHDNKRQASMTAEEKDLHDTVHRAVFR